jgi:hypothetical protein
MMIGSSRFAVRAPKAGGISSTARKIHFKIMIKKFTVDLHSLPEAANGERQTSCRRSPRLVDFGFAVH